MMKLPTRHLQRSMLRPGLIGLAALAMVLTVLMPARQRAAAAVDLNYFKAEWQSTSQTVLISWKTAMELNTTGFSVQRSTSSSTTGFVDITGVIPAVGDQLTGGTYGPVTDTLTSAMGWYRLMEIETDNQPHDIGSVVAVLVPTPTMTGTPTHTPTTASVGAGVQQTATPTPTSTSTATPTRTPTSVLSSSPVPWLMPSTTPIVARGSTVTPLPPAVAAPATAANANPIATLNSDAATVPTALPATTAFDAATPVEPASAGQAAALPTRLPSAVPPTLAPTSATTVAMAPLVVATADAPDAGHAAPAGSANPSALVLIGAAGLLLMGGLYAILRQSQK
jgi:hypothetical protein